MTTSDVKVTPGSGKNVATYSFSEDTETKEAQRVVLNDSTGTEVSPAKAAQLPTTIGQKTNTTSLSVVLSSDHAGVPVNQNTLPWLVSTSNGATDFSKLEDAASASGDAGVPAMAIQKATPADTAADGDYVMHQMSAGRLWTTANVDKVGGTAIDTNSGTKSAGTIRVVLATDQPALTNKLLVTPDANSAVNVAQVNGVTTTTGNGVAGTGVQRVAVASDNTPFAVKTDQTTHGTTDLVAADITKIAGTAIVTGGTAGTQSVGGIQAHDAADSGNNPVKIGAKATSSEPTAVSSGDIANLLTDLVGKLIVLPYANPENFVSGAITSAMTGTTSTSLVAAPASGLRNYITTIIVSNAHATVGTDIIIQDGSGGTTLMTIPAAAVYGGAVINLPVPLRQPTTATAIYCANVTTGASTKVSAVGYKGV